MIDTLEKLLAAIRAESDVEPTVEAFCEDQTLDGREYIWACPIGKVLIGAGHKDKAQALEDFSLMVFPPDEAVARLDTYREQTVRCVAPVLLDTRVGNQALFDYITTLWDDGDEFEPENFQSFADFIEADLKEKEIIE